MVDVRRLIDKKYEELKAQGITNPITLSNMLESYCYNEVGVSSVGLWAYIDDITGFNEMLEA